MKTETGKAAPPPLAVPGNLCLIAGPGHPIACNHPFGYSTLPLVLLHEVFGVFKDRCKAPPSERALAFLDELAAKVCKWYQGDTQRMSAIESVFWDHLGVRFHGEKAPNSEYTTVGNPVVIAMPAAIWECRNYALKQAIQIYSRFINEALTDHRHFCNPNTSFPCILMVDIMMGMSAL